MANFVAMQAFERNDVPCQLQFLWLKLNPKA